MQEDYHNEFRVNHLLLAFVIFQAIFFIVAIGLINSQLGQSNEIEEGNYKAQPHIYIDNLSESIPSFPSEYVDIVQSLLLYIVQNNNSNINLADSKAEVRDGAVYQYYFSRPNISYTSAIIDIPAISQSYQLFFQYSNDEQNEFLDPNDSVVFLCIKDPSNIIYPDFNCKDTYSQKTRNAIAAKYLQFFKFDQFSAGIESKNYNLVNIFPNNFSYVDKDTFLKETKQAIQSLGISPELFEYHIMRPEDITYIIEP